MSTFLALQTESMAECNLNIATADATTLARFKGYLNEGVRRVIGKPGMTRLLDSDVPYPLSSVALQARYVVPAVAESIHGIRDVTNRGKLDAMPLSVYRKRDPDPTTTSGLSSHYVPIGRVAVAMQPTSASALFVKSDTPADTTQVVRIEGTNSVGEPATASVTLTGITAVALSASVTDFVEVTDFYLSAAAAGVVTLTQTSGVGATLARIFFGELRPRYYGFYLWPTPSAITVYSVDYRRAAVDMVNNTDEPPLPADYHYILGAYARMRYYEKTADDRYTIAEGIWKKGLSDLTYTTQTSPDELPVVGRRRRGVPSRLGPMTPDTSGWFQEGF
jgi:hypothetical protein